MMDESLVMDEKLVTDGINTDSSLVQPEQLVRMEIVC